VGAADVVVVGAGASGCSVAAHLLGLDPALRVTLLDAQHVGAGSSSRSTAAFRHQWSVPAHVAFSRYARGEYRRLTDAGHPIGFRDNGYLFLYTDPVLLERAASRAGRQRALGVRVEVLDRDGIRAASPIGVHVDADDIAGATWGPDDGFLDPLAVAQAYLDEARAAGAAYLPRTPVTGFTTAGGRVTGVMTPQGDVAAGRVVLASGVWGGSITPGGLPIRPAKRYLYHSHPVRGVDVSGWPLVIADNGCHARPSEGNTLMFAWEHRPEARREDTPAATLWETQDAIDPGFGAGPDGYGTGVLVHLSRHMSVFAELVSPARVTCGWYAVTPDHKAILGEDPRTPGLFHAAGFSGHGIMHAAATGLTLAELLLGRDTTLAPPDALAQHFGLPPLLEGRLREPVEEMVL